MKKTNAAVVPVAVLPTSHRNGSGVGGNVRICKVCKDTGKPEKMYTSHTTRDKDGTVLCPVLLATMCRYCHENGHTVKYCPVLEAKQKQKEAKEAAAATATATVEKRRNVGCFSYKSLAAMTICDGGEKAENEHDWMTGNGRSCSGGGGGCKRVGKRSSGVATSEEYPRNTPAVVVTTQPAPWAVAPKTTTTVSIYVRSKWSHEEEDEDTEEEADEEADEEDSL